jgi:hypothetical protein
MTDDLERRLTESLRRSATERHDAGVAAATFADRRAARLRSRRTAGAVGLGLVVALAAVTPALSRNLFGGDDRSTIGFASGPSAEASADAGTDPSERPSPANLVTATPEPKPTSGASDTAAPSPAPKPSEVNETTPKPSPPAEVDATATPPATPSPGEEVPPHARVDDNGKTYEIRRGEGLVVLLDGDESFRWSPLEVSDESVLYGEDGKAGGGDQEWKFIGMKAGRVTVSSTQDPACRESTPPCGAPSRSWQITVVVTA